LVRAVVAISAWSTVLLGINVTGSAAASFTVAASHTGAHDAGARTLVGTGLPGFNGDGKPTTKTSLDGPDAVVEDASGDLFIADNGNCRVRELPARTGTTFGIHLRAGVIATLVGGNCHKARANPAPTALAVDRSDNLYIAFGPAARVEVLPARSTTLFGERMTAGKLTSVAGTGVPGFGGDEGTARQAALNDPTGLAVDPSGDLLISDTANCRLRLVASTDGNRFGKRVIRGAIYTVAGNGICGSAGDGGPAAQGELWDPGALAVNTAGDVFVADQGNRTIREVTNRSGTYYGVVLAADALGTVAGEGSYGPYLADGLPAVFETAEINFPTGLAVAANGDLYIADGAMHAIRMVPQSETMLLGKAAQADAMYTAAGALSVGSLHQRTSWIQTRMVDPTGLAIGADGQLIYADTGADVVRALPSET
jgi:hypothetical protein